MRPEKLMRALRKSKDLRPVRNPEKTLKDMQAVLKNTKRAERKDGAA
jgi:hypothetical protein